MIFGTFGTVWCAAWRSDLQLHFRTWWWGTGHPSCPSGGTRSRSKSEAPQQRGGAAAKGKRLAPLVDRGQQVLAVRALGAPVGGGDGPRARVHLRGARAALGGPVAAALAAGVAGAVALLLVLRVAVAACRVAGARRKARGADRPFGGLRRRRRLLLLGLNRANG